MMPKLPNANTGLSAEEYRQNVANYGLNALPEVKPPSKLFILLSQFLNPLVMVLLIAALLTIVVSYFAHDGEIDLTEFIGIMLVVLLNGLLGYFQENKAEDTLKTLTDSIKPHCLVIRSGQQQEVLVNQLTVGDIVELKLGDKVPADGVLLEASGVSANEAILTGESESVAKQKYTGDLSENALNKLEDEYKLFMGTSVMSGIGRMVITQIGSQTKFGQIADSIVSNESSATPLQVRLEDLTKKITITIVAISFIVAVIGLSKNWDIAEIINLSISIAVSAIPEGMVVGLTVILALGMNRILKRNAVVRKLIAAETLGSVDMICIDKTGTLTLGEMKVIQTFFNDQDLALRALLATNHKVNSVEVATLAWLKEHLSAKQEAQFKEEKHLEYKIFDSATKFSATKGEENIYYVAAPEVILEKTNLSSEDKQHWEQEIVKLSTKGMRLVAVGYTPTNSTEFSTEEVPSGINWIGLIAIEDPIRPNLKQVFAQAARAGISVKVITGDYGETARAVLAKIGIDLQSNEMVSGKELRAMSDEELTKHIDRIKLFYRTTPDQKLRIITNLQSKGHVVAMMGDGVNDTPALKKSEIGIVVENATDFSKEISDMVLIDSNFRTIIAAVEEGRSIFENMRKMIAYLLSDALGSIVIIVGSIIIGLEPAMLPLQILFINFVTDGFPDVALAFEQPEYELMKDKPKRKDYPLVDKEVASMILVIGLIVSFGILLLYWILLNQGVSLEYARSFVFLTMGVNTLVYVYPIRSFRRSLLHINMFSNKLLNIAVVIGFSSLLAAMYIPWLQHILKVTPIILSDWVIVMGVALINVLLIELIKYRFLGEKST